MVLQFYSILCFHHPLVLTLTFLNNKQSINFNIYTLVQSSVLWVKLHLQMGASNSLALICCRGMATAIYPLFPLGGPS